jgi:hypothetical protein
MGKFAMAFAAAALTTGVLAPVAHAQNVQPTPYVTDTSTQTSTPAVQPLACNGTTGPEGCGPGWFWRDGERGWACYLC